jgi:hypothetical protein
LQQCRCQRAVFQRQRLFRCVPGGVNSVIIEQHYCVSLLRSGFGLDA